MLLRRFVACGKNACHIAEEGASTRRKDHHPSAACSPSSPARPCSFSRRRIGPRMGTETSIGDPFWRISSTPALASDRATERVRSNLDLHSLGDAQIARGISLGQQLLEDPRFVTRCSMTCLIRSESFAWWGPETCDPVPGRARFRPRASP